MDKIIGTWRLVRAVAKAAGSLTQSAAMRWPARSDQTEKRRVAGSPRSTIVSAPSESPAVCSFTSY